MPKKSRTSRKTRGISAKTRKQKIINMIGCSKKHKHNKSCKNNKDLGCPNCGPNCHCGPNCNCPHPCLGSCYLNRTAQKGGFGMGPMGRMGPMGQGMGLGMGQGMGLGMGPGRGSCMMGSCMMGGSGCGSCGCPVGGLTYKQMNKFGGAYPKDFNKPVLIDDSNKGEFIKIPGATQIGGNCGGTCQAGGNCGGMCQAGGNCGGMCQAGGNCGGMCQAGGNFFKPASPIPGPFTGSPWGASVSKWPSMNDIGGDRNYLQNSSGVISNDPQRQMIEDSGYKTLTSIIGGKKGNKGKSKKSSKKMQSGGGLIPQDLLNLGRNFTFNLQSAYNSLNGYNQPVNPMPYKDQLPRSNKILI